MRDDRPLSELSESELMNLLEVTIDAAARAGSQGMDKTIMQFYQSQIMAIKTALEKMQDNNSVRR